MRQNVQDIRKSIMEKLLNHFPRVIIRNWRSNGL